MLPHDCNMSDCTDLIDSLHKPSLVNTRNELFNETEQPEMLVEILQVGLYLNHIDTMSFIPLIETQTP